MKKITKSQEAELKAEHLSRKAKRNKIVVRLFYFLIAIGNISIVAFLVILNADPQIGHYVLSAFSGISALYFTIKLIGE